MWPNRSRAAFYFLLFTVEHFYCFRLNLLFTSTVQCSVSRPISPSLVNQNSRYLNYFIWAVAHSQPQRINPPFSSRAPSDFPGASHSTANCPSAHRRSQSLTDRMKSSDAKKGPSECLLDASLWRCSRHVQLGDDPWENQEHTGGTTYGIPSSLETSPGKSWRTRIGRRMNGLPCLACCHCGLD